MEHVSVSRVAKLALYVVVALFFLYATFRAEGTLAVVGFGVSFLLICGLFAHDLTRSSRNHKNTAAEYRYQGAALLLLSLVVGALGAFGLVLLWIPAGVLCVAAFDRWRRAGREGK